MTTKVLVKPEPDTARLGALYQQIKGLSRNGSLTRAKYDEIASEAEQASAGHSDLTTFVMLFAEDEWLE